MKIGGLVRLFVGNVRPYANSSIASACFYVQSESNSRPCLVYPQSTGVETSDRAVSAGAIYCDVPANSAAAIVNYRSLLFFLVIIVVHFNTLFLFTPHANIKNIYAHKR